MINSEEKKCSGLSWIYLPELYFVLLMANPNVIYPFCLPVNAEHGDNPHCGELVADVDHHHRLAHKVSKDPLPVSDQLVDVKGHHQQKQHVGYGQVQHVDVRHHLLLAHRHRVDDQPVGDDPHRAQDAVNGRQNVHEGGDVHEAVGRRCGAQARGAGEVAGLVVLAQRDGVVHLRLPLVPQRAVRSAADPGSKLGLQSGALSKYLEQL